MANKHLIETFRRNGRNYLRLNHKRAEPNYKPKPVLKPGWKLPEYPEIYCFSCQERIRPIAYDDCDELYLSIGCQCDAFIEEIDWPFTEEQIWGTKHFEALGFEFV